MTPNTLKEFRHLYTCMHEHIYIQRQREKEKGNWQTELLKSVGKRQIRIFIQFLQLSCESEMIL